MFNKQKEYIRNIYTVIFKRKKKDLIKFFLVSTPGSLAALLEGLTFSLLLSSLYIFNGSGLDVFSGKPIISKIADISFLQRLSSNQLFLIMITSAIGAQIVKALIIYFSSLQAAKLNARISCTIHQNVYEHILSFNFQTISSYKTGKLVTFTQIPTTAITPLLQASHKIIIQSCVLIALGIFLFSISLPLTLFFAGFFAISGFIYKKILTSIGRHSEKCASYVINFSNEVVQALAGIKLIHIFGMQKTILEKSRSVMGEIQNYQKKSSQLQNLSIAIGEIFSMGMMATTLVVSSFFLVTTREHSLPLLLTYIAIAYRFTTTSRELINQFGVFAANIGSILKLNEILRPQDKSFEPTSGKKATPLKKGIQFQKVSFQYPNSKDYSLNKVSLSIPHGKMTAIVGLSGAGKTSIVSLITRLFDPTKGEILVDGVDINHYNIQSWRTKLGVVTQNTIIFNESVRENICFGTKATDDEVFNACKIAGCYEVIQNLPKGLDSSLGEHGYKISGGEAQRIAIARALIRKPEIIILDEATSSLDSHNEQIIQKALSVLRSKCTLIMIAHRLSTTTSADQIVVLRNGQVVEMGNHGELLEKNGEYAYLWSLQTNKSPENEFVVSRV